MSTTQQKLFNQWMKEHYQELRKKMPLPDIMHDAYVTVYCFRRPIIPTGERFHSLMSEAYHRHLLKEFNHSMHFILPDPLFWFYLDENEDLAMLTTEDAPSAPERSISDVSTYNLQKLFALVKHNFSKQHFTIFRMAIAQQMSYSEIAQALGMKRAEVKHAIDEIETFIREKSKPIKAK